MEDVPKCFITCGSCRRKKHECICKNGYWVDEGIDQLGRPIRRKCAFNQHGD
jgi:hypothetical protein